MEAPSKTKNRVAIQSSNPTPGHIYGENSNLKSTCTPMFITALFTIAKTWKQPKCSFTDEWINKISYRYIMQYYSTIRKNEIMPYEAT